MYEKLVGKEDLEWTRVHLSADQVTRMNNFFELSEGPYFKVQKHGNYNDYNGPQVTDDLERKEFLAPIKGMKMSKRFSEIKMRLVQYLRDCERVIFAVPHVRNYKEAWPEYHYKAAALVCQRMKKSLQYKKRNTLTQVLNSLLYEMHPRSSAERKLMP